MSVRFGLGARYSTALVKDSLVVPVTLQPALAPTIQLGVRDDLRGAWSADGTLDLSSSKLKRQESGGSFDAGSVTTVAFTLGLHRRLATDVTARLGVGGLLYSGSDLGLFQQGGGGLNPVISLGSTYAPPFGQRHAIEISLQYDIHRFLTPAMRSVGFNKPRPVHRLAVAVSARLLGGTR